MDRTDSPRRPLTMPRALVFSVAVGGAFGVGLVFGGGGVRAQGNEAQPLSPKDAIARANERTAAYEALVKASTSTWHAEITSPEPAAPAAPAAPSTPQPKKEVAVPADVAPAVAASADIVAAVREDAVRTAEQNADPMEAKDAVDSAKAEADDDEGDVARPQAPDPARLRTALTKVLDSAPATAPTASSTTSSERRYAVQLASAATEDGARVIADGFKQKGFAPVIVAAEIPGRGVVYRVRLTGLQSRAAADALKARVGQGLVVTE